ncbi:MAG: ABC transporter substrate-binding protein, partial [Desulfobacterales bacterium]|nr:ABC transporter substrate-binding protein [Desulfobacterales bacterium]
MKKLYPLLLIVLMFALVATGCVKDAVTDPDEPVNDGPRVLRETGAKVTTLNQFIYETSAESGVMGNIYGNLLAMIYDKEIENYKLIGDHAVDLPTRSEDGLTWTFKIRDGVTFADGTPITAETYEESYKILLDPKLANTRTASFTEDVSVVNALNYFKGEVTDWSEVGIKALDKNTLELKLEFAIPEIDFYLNFSGGGPTSPIHLELFNECYLDEDKTENNYGTSLDTTPSSGVYKLVEWVRDQYRKYEKREDYAIASYYVPTTVEERVVEDKTARVQLFENGETDYLSLTGSDYDKYAEDPRLRFST